MPFDGLRVNGGRIHRRGHRGRKGGFVEAGFRRLLRNSAYCHSECGAGPATRLVLEAGILDSSLRFAAFGITMALRRPHKGMKMGWRREWATTRVCPYNRFAGAYFHSNRSCSLAVCTPRDESRYWFRRGHSAADSGRRWIPASAGMTGVGVRE